MTDLTTADNFLSQYSDEVFENTHKVRKLILRVLPEIIEDVDISAKMLSYNYGKRYIDTVCVLIPSKKGLKFGFYQGVDLPDPENLLSGNGKLSRYVEIKKQDDIKIKPLTVMLREAFKLYKTRTNK